MNELKVNLTDAPLRCLRKAGLVRRRENAGSAGGRCENSNQSIVKLSRNQSLSRRITKPRDSTWHGQVMSIGQVADWPGRYFSLLGTARALPIGISPMRYDVSSPQRIVGNHLKMAPIDSGATHEDSLCSRIAAVPLRKARQRDH